MDPMIAKNLRLLLMIAKDRMREDQRYYIQNLLIDGSDLGRNETLCISSIRAEIAKSTQPNKLHMVTV